MEIFLEFLYYIIDSLLIPLLRNNFYITESNTDKYKVFYFRQDIWKMIADPAMDGLKDKMLEEFTPPNLKSITASRKLGVSKIRLLPKGSKLRPITNLKRREMSNNKSKTLLRSINSIMKPVHTMLQLEKASFDSTYHHSFLLTSTHRPLTHPCSHHPCFLSANYTGESSHSEHILDPRCRASILRNLMSSLPSTLSLRILY